jgi:hypothetical protein
MKDRTHLVAVSAGHTEAASYAERNANLWRVCQIAAGNRAGGAAVGVVLLLRNSQ